MNPYKKISAKGENFSLRQTQECIDLAAFTRPMVETLAVPADLFLVIQCGSAFHHLLPPAGVPPCSQHSAPAYFTPKYLHTGTKPHRPAAVLSRGAELSWRGSAGGWGTPVARLPPSTLRPTLNIGIQTINWINIFLVDQRESPNTAGVQSSEILHLTDFT